MYPALCAYNVDREQRDEGEDAEEYVHACTQMTSVLNVLSNLQSVLPKSESG